MTTQATGLRANLSEEVVETLNIIASRRNCSIEEVLRQAIATEKYVSDVQDKGGKLLVETPDGQEVREVVFEDR